MYNSVLRGLIMDASLNQRKLATILGMKGATLSKIISGKNNKLEHRQLIADYFNKPINQIFRGRK
jgi:transcriptional regulator with XRE-family HTH domain